MSKLSFKSAIPESKYTTFIQGHGDINKYTIVYCYGKLFKKVFLKLTVLDWKEGFIIFTDIIFQVSKNNNIYPNLKGIM